jgi:hypothetical protein
MTATELLSDIYTVYRGKIASRTPAWGSDKANVAISIANRKIQEWATDPRNKWNSLFEITAVGTTISTSTQTYNLGATFFAPSDFAKAVKTDDSYVEYPITKAQQRDVTGGQSLYVHGSNPKKITFSQTIDAGIDGGTLYVAGYYIPSSLTLSTSVVPVDDPIWLVYSVAAELARNDPAKEDQYPSLAGMANDLYTKMSNANNDTGFLQPNNVVNGMPTIGNDTDIWYI